MSLKPRPLKFWSHDTIKYWGDILGDRIHDVEDVRQVTDFDAFDVLMKDGSTVRVSGQQLLEAERRWQNVNS